MRGNNWDIFCSVVDNFGDIGVCWRLARQLAAEHGLQVRLWVDDLASFQPLCPELDPGLEMQTQRGVEVRRWPQRFPQIGTNDVADVVIEAFACELPDEYLAAMAARVPKPAWINLEYLSAEPWVTGCHGLASPHPRLPLTKHFYFPGFVANSGGLLREARLLQQRDAWQADLAGSADSAAADWARLGLPAPYAGAINISLFCYENPALPALLQAWAASAIPLRCLVPAGRALTQVAACLGKASLHPGDTLQLGNLTLCALPFVSQEDYDHLLWSCDLNFVRGEDSFVRAQWAARPLAWHIYPQDDDANLPKLAAFLDLYCAGLSPEGAAACREFWLAWNHDDADRSGCAAAWPEFLRHLPTLATHAGNWSEYQAKQRDLAGNLVHYCENLL